MIPLKQRFDAKWIPEPNSGCWLWTGCLMPNGYGQIQHRGTLYAHRVAYELYVGPIPADLTIDHLCRTRSCVNPAHLEPVTFEENIRRGEWHNPRTHCKRGHPLSGENVLRFPSGKQRFCKLCRIKQQRNYYLANREKLMAQQGEYRRAHPEMYRAIAARQRAKPEYNERRRERRRQRRLQCQS